MDIHKHSNIIYFVLNILIFNKIFFEHDKSLQSKNKVITISIYANIMIYMCMKYNRLKPQFLTKRFAPFKPHNLT
jgi:hypothetical protein